MPRGKRLIVQNCLHPIVQRRHDRKDQPANKHGTRTDLKAGQELYGKAVISLAR